MAIVAMLNEQRADLLLKEFDPFRVIVTDGPTRRRCENSGQNNK